MTMLCSNNTLKLCTKTDFVTSQSLNESTQSIPKYISLLVVLETSLPLEKKNVSQQFLFALRFNVPVNNFSVMSGWSQHFLGINQYPGDLKCLAQTQHSAASGNGIQNLSIRRPMVYH